MERERAGFHVPTSYSTTVMLVYVQLNVPSKHLPCVRHVFTPARISVFVLFVYVRVSMFAHVRMGERLRVPLHLPECL